MGCDIHPYAEVRINGRWKRARVHVPNDRDYWTFALLANVRNGRGFAGCSTGDPVRPISEPRGLPEDRATFDTPDLLDNDYAYRDPDYVNLGDHSFSWVTLEELLKVDLDAPIFQRGIVTQAQKTALDRDGTPPDTWCGWKSPMTADDVQAQWSTPIREAAYLLPKIINALKEYADYRYKPEDVRIVFGFDS